ncbi:MAG: hypothetical protein KDC95_07090 [Planctomycetes bacterium]|nr:hypothetical protein [Planctomycetota bacterium]
MKHTPFAFTAILFLSGVSTAQVWDNYLPQDLTKFGLTVNRNEINMDLYSSSKIIMSAKSSSVQTPVTCQSPKFRVPTTGTYLLQTNCEALSFGSPHTSSWSLGGASGSWRQVYDPANFVPQWFVQLTAGVDYTLTIHTDVPSGGNGIVRIGNGRLYPTDLPALRCVRCDNPQFGPNVAWEITPSVSYANPGYLVYIGSRLWKPIPIPALGTLWLTSPLLISATTTTHQQFGYPDAIADVAYRAMTGGTHWQVVEFDRNKPASTLRLGGLTVTQRLY